MASVNENRKRRRRSWRRVATALGGCLLGLVATRDAAAVGEHRFELRGRPSVPTAIPPLPSPGDFPVQLVLDDDGAEGAFGVLGGHSARQFLWFNRFGPVPLVSLEEVWVLFPTDAPVGGAVQIVVFEDTDGNPTSGATLRSAFDATVQAADGNTFSLYPLPAPVLTTAGNDLLIGVVPRFVVSGQTPPLLPAALDSTASAGRSWFATWVADPPDPPSLPADQLTAPIDGFQPGNWMIRGFGVVPSVVEIPALGGWGVGALIGLLALVGFVALRRRRVLLALPFALLASAAQAQSTIDSFTTNQGALSAPPDASSSVTGGADILGTRRGIVAKNLAGAGPTGVSVAGGNLVLTVTATTPDSRGEARLSWDGDTNPLVLSPTGLGGVNLTGSFARGFRLQFAATTVLTEVELAVYTNATDVSRAARLVAVSGAAQDVLIPFAEFRVAGGAGANFANVGAIEMTVRAGEGTVTMTHIDTTLPALAATKVDVQTVDTDSDTRVDPGDRVRYTVTLTNTGNQALNVALSDTVDGNTTLVAGSVSATPIAQNDQYGWFGNVTLAVDGTPLPALLANDSDPDGDTVSVQSGSFPSTTTRGGSVSLVNAATGEFSYSPPPGFAGVDSFAYTIVDNDAHVSTATAYVALEGVVWFVDDSNTTAPFNGTQSDPFQTLASLMGTDPDQTGDTIFVYDDDGTPYPGGLVLETGQKLIGEGTGLVLSSTTIVPAGGRPQITNTGGVGLTLATDNTIRGLDVTGTSGAGILGSSFGTLTTSNLNLTATGGSALDLATGTLAATVGTLSSTGAGGQRGIRLQSVTGSLTATTTTLTNPTTQGIGVSGSPGVTLDFGNTTITDNAIASGPTATGVDLASGNAGASFTFASLTVTTDAGVGLLANGSGTISIGGTSSSIVANARAAVDITSTSLGSGATFSTLSSANSTGKGVNLDAVTGALVATGGAISNPTGVGFDLNAGSSTVTYGGSITNTANAALVEITGRTGGTVTLSGGLSSTVSGNGLNVASNSGGTIVFSGAAKVLNTGADTAVTLASNGGATINFTGGGLDIDTTSGTGFSASGGATAITIQGPGNSLNATSGATALSVVNTPIGASGLTFARIDSTGGTAPGILLDNSGAGGLTVTGDGGGTNNGSGGTISGKSGSFETSGTPGVRLRNGVSNVRLRYMNITGNNHSGIYGGIVANPSGAIDTDTINGFELHRCNITNNGDSSGSNPDEVGVDLYNLVGTASGGTNPTSITDTVISNNFEFELQITNALGTLANLQMSGSTISSDGATGQHGNLFSFLTAGESSSSMTLNLTSGTLAGAAPATATAVQCDHSGNGGTMTCNISGASFTNNNVGPQASVAGSGQVVFNFSNNTITGTRSSAINFFADANPPFSPKSLTGRVQNNIIGTLGTPNSGAQLGPAIRIQNEGAVAITMLISGNTVQEVQSFQGINVNVGLSGIATGGLATNLTIQNNTIREIDGSRGITVQDNQTTAPSFPTVCTNISGNSFSNIAGQAGNGEYMRVRELNGTFNVTQAMPTATANAAELDDANGFNNPALINVTGGVAFSQPGCPTPP